VHDARPTLFHPYGSLGHSYILYPFEREILCLSLYNMCVCPPHTPVLPFVLAEAPFSFVVRSKGEGRGSARQKALSKKKEAFDMYAFVSISLWVTK